MHAELRRPRQGWLLRRRSRLRDRRRAELDTAVARLGDQASGVHGEANAALFLASDLASFTTGSTVTADGGANQT